jgi:hypothetical protein
MGRGDGRGLDCLALLRGTGEKGGGQAFTCFGVKSELSEIYFLGGWEVLCGKKKKVRQAEDLYLCQIFSSESEAADGRCRQEAGRGSR